MKKFLILAVLLGFQAHADGFTEDWFTSCQKTSVKKVDSKDIQINGKTFKIDSTLSVSGTSVYLGKDVQLANFLLNSVLANQCTGLSQGIGTAMVQVSGRALDNPYTELRIQDHKDKSKLVTDALDLLIGANFQEARVILQVIRQSIPQQK